MIRHYIQSLIQTSALTTLMATVLPFAAPDFFIYKSAYSAEGPSIPSWVAASCCGPKDAHKLRADQVYDMGDYYIVDGIQEKINKTYSNGHQNETIKPSQDGDYWAFYSNSAAGWVGSPEMTHEHWEDGRQNVYCLFIPMSI